MKKGKILGKKSPGDTTGDFNISFSQSNYGPYTHIFHRENLYFNEAKQERGSYDFPLKETEFQNTEIFLENNDIVLAVGKRGSFSGASKRFLEIVNIKTAEKHRFYPETVSLIYNTQESIVIYYSKFEKDKRLELSKETLERMSESHIKLKAFFKLMYNYDEKTYLRLVYKANSHSHKAGYFIEESIHSDIMPPISFTRSEFMITSEGGNDIDVWEASLTGEL